MKRRQFPSLTVAAPAGWFTAGVSTTCSMLGQAAGIAAAMSAAENCDPRQLDPAEVRREVERRGAQLNLG